MDDVNKLKRNMMYALGNIWEFSEGGAFLVVQAFRVKKCGGIGGGGVGGCILLVIHNGSCLCRRVTGRGRGGGGLHTPCYPSFLSKAGVACASVLLGRVSG